MADLDLVNRDPNDINSHVQVKQCFVFAALPSVYYF